MYPHGHRCKSQDLRSHDTRRGATTPQRSLALLYGGEEDGLEPVFSGHPHELVSLSIPSRNLKLTLLVALEHYPSTSRRRAEVPVSHEFEHSCPNPVQTDWEEGIQIPANARPFDRSRKNSSICQAPCRRERTAKEQLYRTRHHASEVAQFCCTSRPAINRKAVHPAAIRMGTKVSHRCSCLVCESGTGPYWHPHDHAA